jgi:plasmid stabilization system protein ParE
MKPVQVHPESKAEKKGAFEWYWERSEASAIGFDAELRKALSVLRKSPAICAPRLRGMRRAILGRYPYFAVLRELPRKLQIIAVAHAKRRPGY